MEELNNHSKYSAGSRSLSGGENDLRDFRRDLSSGEKVFDVVELAEMILCLLPLGDIFSMQQVCRRSHEVIQTSKTVQKGLCVFTARELAADSNFGASIGLVFHFRSADGLGDMYFRLQYVTQRTKSTFDINFEMLSPYQGNILCYPGKPTRQKPITIVEGSETGDELWRKVRWVAKGVKRGGSLWLEKTTSTGEFIWSSRSLSKEATLGETWELLREMEGDKLIC